MSEAVSEAFATIMCRQFNATQTEVSETAASLDGSFMLANTYLIFFMQAGFAMLCAGSVRTKNYMNILLKNVLDACFGAPVFYLVGYGFAYGAGTPTNKFIGNNDFALEDFTDWNVFIFQWAFAAATATIVSGSVAERCTFHAYIAYSTLLTGFVYPVVVHWVWSSEGWLTAFAKDDYATNKDDLLLNSGMMDFAGSGVVHMTGGFAGLMGAFFIGPRIGRFSPTGPNPDFQGHSNTLVVLGTFVLWFGWYGFNPGSQLTISTANDLTIVGRAAVTTTLSGACAGVAALFIAKYRDGIWDLAAVCNGVLAGLVGVTAGNM
ncbi:ammonium transporter, variant 2 [Cymbomonas tetramitiformis]|uniref:Ammonium transporter, variant 2 n=1 Tax=Cymbomonas tetramitiformis TaxID=36881 RepID=A0AAE0H1E4_9CHLO|nr:ammonium transporter, variant 2 [Cymbomonas tetramitiformis]